MKFWVVEERDTFLRGCHVQKLEPVNLQPSTAKCPSCGAALEPLNFVLVPAEEYAEDDRLHR